MNSVCQTPFGEFCLQRWPSRRNERLQAWDAADLLLLAHLHEHGLAGRLLILNDRFGALTCALRERSPTLWSDSELSRLAMVQNLKENGAEPAVFVPGDHEPEGLFETVLCRVPKSLEHWREQLTKLRGHLREKATVLVGGMTKHLPHRALELMRTCLGPAERFDAVKKARLLKGTFDPQLMVDEAVEPAVLDIDGLTLTALPNVFSRDRLDRGSRLLLSTFDNLPPVARALDLGCGNGLLAIRLQQALPEAHLTLVDESYQAVSSARTNYQQHCKGEAEFLVADGLLGYQGDNFDLVVCNPPFHQQHQVSDWLAGRLFRHSRDHLRSGGELRVVGNRHLGYHRVLKRLFGNSRVLASDPKFVVLSSTR